MTRMPVLSGRDVVKALVGAGFEAVAQRGSHIRLKRRRAGTTHIVIVPDHRELAPGTLASIRRQTGLDRDEFLALIE